MMNKYGKMALACCLAVFMLFDMLPVGATGEMPDNSLPETEAAEETAVPTVIP